MKFPFHGMLSHRKKKFTSGKKSKKGDFRRFTPGLEILEDRVVPSTFGMQVFDDGVPVVGNTFYSGNNLVFIGTSAHFSSSLVIGTTNNPGSPTGAVLSLGPQSEVSITDNGTHTLTVELTSTDFSAPTGTPLVLSSSAGGEVNATNGDVVTATYQSVLDPTNTPYGNGAGVPLGASPAPVAAESTPPTTATASGVEAPLVFSPAAATNVVTSATPFALTAIATFQFSSAQAGDFANVGANTTAGPSTVTQATPTITTSQQPAIAFVGESISDTATVTGLVSPSSGDTVTFNLYNNNSASGTPLFTDTETVTISGGTATATSAPYPAAAIGTDYWVATYNGDSGNTAVTSSPTAEPVNIDTITTSQTPAIAYVGESIADTATVTGLVSPSSGDTVTFNLYSSATTQNSSTLLFSDTEAVSITGSTGTATSAGYMPTGVGTEYWVATFNGDTNNAAATSGATAETVNVDTINTMQTPAIAYVGESISDTATVTGLVLPQSSDSVTFKLYSSATTQNSSTLLFSDTEAVTITGSTATAASAGYSPTGVGTEYWVATFSGDTNNAAVTSGATAETVNVDTINTCQTPAIAYVGESISDTATVTGLVSPSSSDTVTFNLYSSATTQNSSTRLFSSTRTVSISGSTATATSPGYTPTGVGTEYWVATFNGDTNNAAVTSGTADEPVNVDTINTMQTPAIAYVGESISDTATVTGLVSPSSADTVTFNLYSSATTQNSSTLLFSSTKTVTISGSTATATSPGYTTTGVGTEYWVATFNGDTNNAAVTSGTAAETVNVDTITTSQTPAIAYVGESISDTATVTGLVSPSSSDTVTFNLYSSATTQNSSTLLFTSTKTVTITGSTATATSAGYSPTGVGTEYWVATFSGDTNNAAVTSGSAAEAVHVDTITTSQQPASAVVGSSIADQATVTGLVNASSSDTVTFKLYSSATTQNSSTLLFTNTQTVAITGSTATATSAGYTAPTTGTDYWVATFNGDTNNAVVTSGATAEPVNVTAMGPKLVTAAGAGVALGSSGKLTDSATLSGGFSATGTITFYLFAPGVTPSVSGSGNVYSDVITIGTNSGSVTGNGTYTTAMGANPGGYTPTVTGTYQWVAVYSGDRNNAGAADQGSSTAAFNADLPSTATEDFTAQGQGGSYWTVSLSSAGDLNGTYQDWCIDTGHSSSTGQNYTVNVYATTGTIPAGLVPTPGNFSEVNWVLNQSYVGQTGPSGNAITYGDVQLAIWSLLGVPTSSSGVGTTNQTDVNYIENQAGSHGTFVPGFGQEVAVILQPVTSNQITICVVPTGVGEQALVTPGSPSITTSQQPASALVGTSIADQATITGLVSPNSTDTVTFKLYNNSTASGTPLFTSAPVTVSISGSTASATSPGYTATATGTDYWVATFNGDSNNNAVTSGATAEPVTINKATPAINTSQQPASATVGSTVADQATVTGGYSPTGTVTFNLYSSATTQNSSTLVYTVANVALNGSGVATSPGYTTTATGTDYWVATYNGNSNNNSVNSAPTAEPVTITPAGPTLTTTPGGTVQISSISISGTKFQDLTGNGFSSDDTPQSGVTIDLYNSTTGLGTGSGYLAQTTTASNGTFSFGNLSAGTYYVQEAVPSGYVQTGGGPSGSAGNTYYTVVATAGHAYAGYKFDDYFIPTCQPTCVTYTITTPSNCTTTVSSLAGNTAPGDKVTVTFTTTMANEQLTLVSYSAPSAGFSDSTAYQQLIYQQATQTYATPGTYSLTVYIPNCYYQIDFICGQAISQLEPNQNGDAYGPDKRRHHASWRESLYRERQRRHDGSLYSQYRVADGSDADNDRLGGRHR